jgi:hypothetical protein
VGDLKVSDPQAYRWGIELYRLQMCTKSAVRAAIKQVDSGRRQVVELKDERLRTKGKPKEMAHPTLDGAPLVDHDWLHVMNGWA